MRYVPIKIEENVNVEGGSKWTHMLSILASLSIILLIAYYLLGLVVDFIVPYVPVEYEKNLSKLFISQTLEQFPPDGKYNKKRVQAILDKLVRNMGNSRKLDYRIYILKNDDVNALAFPGGNIIIFSALLDKIESENELAMVLAHELGHFVHRDHLKGLGRTLLFFMLSTILTGGNDLISRIMLNMGNGINYGFSRIQEEKADLYGLSLVNKTYGHVGGAIDFFKKLDKKKELPIYMHLFATHPYTNKRIELLKNEIKKRGYKIEKTIPYNTNEN
jgi:Zn-dependent protease with chaperone function